MTDRLLTVEQVAERLNAKESHVRQLIFRREIVQTKVGRLTRVAESDLETYLQENRVSGDAA